jgi:hypothetical protein
MLLEREDLRLPPSIERLAWVCALFGIAVLLWAMIAGIRHLCVARPPAWAWKVLGLVASHATLVLGTPLALFAADPWFLRGDYVDSLDVESGARYYLYSGLLCSYEVRVRDARSLVLRRVDRVSPHPCVRGVHLGRDARSGQVVVVGPDGQQVVSGSWPGFFLGPH